MPPRQQAPHVPSQLEIDRLSLLKQLGLRTDHAPPCWQDSSDPTLQLKLNRGRKLSVQQSYASGISKPVRKREKQPTYGAAPTYLDQEQMARAGMPGPGEYYRDDTKDSISGGRFSTAFPKTEIEVKGEACPGIQCSVLLFQDLTSVFKRKSPVVLLTCRCSCPPLFLFFYYVPRVQRLWPPRFRARATTRPS